ncbi:MAG: subclass B1 metallo-beta-lactamase [Cyclobacteriaceae bacterium]|nr:subclass B1 metallo-beta-lactamase [Cyclobacteriaceae bacterium]
MGSCQKQPSSQSQSPASPRTDAPQQDTSVVYQTENLIIQRLARHVYQHTSFLNTTDFGRVSCNGMMVVNGNEAIVFDTPATDESSKELILYIENNLQAAIKALVPTHFHDDCVGGLAIFNASTVPVFASKRTIALLAESGKPLTGSIKEFDDLLVVSIGDKKVFAEYFGEGHTKDNVIGSFPEDHAIFGGCLIKAWDATKGNLEDANTAAWSKTVHKLKQKYPQAKIVIPGHGKWGGTELFDYTMALFQ